MTDQLDAIAKAGKPAIPPLIEVQAALAEIRGEVALGKKIWLGSNVAKIPHRLLDLVLGELDRRLDDIPRIAKLEEFKHYVHQKLDEAGVPADPNPERTKSTGCRIENRLDWLIEGSKFADVMTGREKLVAEMAAASQTTLVPSPTSSFKRPEFIVFHKTDLIAKVCTAMSDDLALAWLNETEKRPKGWKLNLDEGICGIDHTTHRHLEFTAIL
jgi:hypothetical protein